MSESRVTASDLAELERGLTQALAIVVGLLAEAAGSQKLAYHLAGALQAADANQANPMRDRLLADALHLVVLKAIQAAPEDAYLQGLAMQIRSRQTKH